jgi:hypothetical protein
MTDVKQLLPSHFIDKPFTIKETLKILNIKKVGDPIPCSTCDGSGRSYRFEDRDCVEGYKLAEKKTCLKCSGLGRTTSFDLFKTLEEDRKKYNKFVYDYNLIVKALNTSRAHLTVGQRCAIGLVDRIDLLEKSKSK